MAIHQLYKIMMYTGNEAQRIVGEILDSINDEGHYPLHEGDTGYFCNPDGKWSAFDNRTCDCWCEDFDTEQEAKEWCEGTNAAPIDNKNVMEDWIYEEVFKNGYMETPWNKDRHRSIIGYIDEILIMADWTFGDNHIRFRAFGRIHMFQQKWRTAVYTKAEENKALEVLEKVTKSFLALNEDKNSDLKVWTIMSDCRELDLYCSFSWKKQ